MSGAALTFVARHRLVAVANMARYSELTARRALAEAVAALVGDWPGAASVALISDWLSGQDLRRHTPETLALDWLWRNGFIDHGAPWR